MTSQDSTSRPIEILMVEDNSGDVRLAREALLDAKVWNNLQHVSDGIAAIQLLRREGEYRDAPRPDLILLDLNLPRKDGREVLFEIKQDAVLATIPVVVLTTSSAEEDVLRSYGLHANCYIVKPMDFEQFTMVVRSIEHFWFSIVTLPQVTAPAA